MTPEPRGALDGIRVLDLAHVIAGPFAATLLADMGADVIKIEAPGSGDGMRALGPKEHDIGLWWRVAGRNKRSLELDLRVPAGRKVLLGLVAQADVLIESFRPGTLEGWNLGPDALQKANPSLIMLRISGYGQDDPGRRPGFGRVAEAMSGVVNLTGEADGSPLHVGFSIGDNVTGLMGAFAVVCALHARRATSRGDVIDLALFESLFRMIEWQIPLADRLGQIVHRRGNEFPLGYAVGGSFIAADGIWITISAATQPTIRRILLAVGGEQFADDPRVATMEARIDPENLSLVYERVRQWVAERPAAEALEHLGSVDVVAGYVYDAGMMLDDETFERREAIVEVPDQTLGKMRMPGVVPKLSTHPGSIRRPAPGLGQHNREILAGMLNMSEHEIEQLYSESPGDGKDARESAPAPKNPLGHT